jgi:hypothetical protein
VLEFSHPQPGLSGSVGVCVHPQSASFEYVSQE